MNDSFRRSLDLLRGFVDKHGWEKLNQRTIVEGVQLGSWLNTRRLDYKSGNVPDALKAELESIPGWSWDPHNDSHRRNLALLRDFVAKRGWAAFSFDLVVEGVSLGSWVTNRQREYKKGKLVGWLKPELESIPGWSWSTRDSRHRRVLIALRDFVAKNGWDSFTTKTIFDGVPIGVWVNGRRGDYKDGSLPDWLKNELESIPGWSWDTLRDRHLRNLGLLRSFVKSQGWEEFRDNTVVDGVPLGKWVGKRRGDHKKGKLADWLKTELVSIPGWQWSAR